MTSISRSGSGFSTSLRWEVTRWVRSRRVFLLAVPVVAGPVGSLLAFLYLKVASSDTAGLLGVLAGFSVSVLLVYLLLERALTLAVPAGLAVAGAATLLLGLRTYVGMDVGGS